MEQAPPKNGPNLVSLPNKAAFSSPKWGIVPTCFHLCDCQVAGQN